MFCFRPIAERAFVRLIESPFSNLGETGPDLRESGLDLGEIGLYLGENALWKRRERVPLPTPWAKHPIVGPLPEDRGRDATKCPQRG